MKRALGRERGQGQKSLSMLGGAFKLQRHILHQLHRALPRHSNHNVAQRPRRESGLRIREIALPLPPENLHVPLPHPRMLAPQRWPDLRAELAQERLAPHPHRLRVVRADILDAVDDEGAARAGRDGGDEPRDGGQVAAGEDVAGEVVGAGVGGVAGVGIVMHWKTATPPSRFSKRSMPAG